MKLYFWFFLVYQFGWSIAKARYHFHGTNCQTHNERTNGATQTTKPASADYTSKQISVSFVCVRFAALFGLVAALGCICFIIFMMRRWLMLNRSTTIVLNSTALLRFVMFYSNKYSLEMRRNTHFYIFFIFGPRFEKCVPLVLERLADNQAIHEHNIISSLFIYNFWLVVFVHFYCTHSHFFFTRVRSIAALLTYKYLVGYQTEIFFGGLPSMCIGLACPALGNVNDLGRYIRFCICGIWHKQKRL